MTRSEAEGRPKVERLSRKLHDVPVAAPSLGGSHVAPIALPDHACSRSRLDGAVTRLPLEPAT